MKLAKQPEQRLSARRRFMAGPVGCGLCGIDSIEQALRPLHPLEECSTTFTTRDIAAAVASLGAAQALNAKTHATHGAGFFGRVRGFLPCARISGGTMRSTS